MQDLVQVDFQGDTIWAVQTDGEVLVALKPICETLSLSWHGHLERAKRDNILGQGIRVIRIPSPGGDQQTTCLPLNLIPGWLFGIDDRRIPDAAVRHKVLAYKRECYAALYDHFFGKAAPAAPAEQRVLLPGDADFAEAVRLVREARLSRGKDAAISIWRRLGLPWVAELEPAPVKDLAADDAVDPVARFALEGVERRQGVATPCHVLFTAFAAFCAAQRLVVCTERSFFMRFATFGFHKRRTTASSQGGTRHVIYYDIAPRREADTAPASA